MRNTSGGSLFSVVESWGVEFIKCQILFSSVMNSKETVALIQSFKASSSFIQWHFGKFHDLSRSSDQRNVLLKKLAICRTFLRANFMELCFIYQWAVIKSWLDDLKERRIGFQKFWFEVCQSRDNVMDCFRYTTFHQGGPTINYFHLNVEKSNEATIYERGSKLKSQSIYILNWADLCGSENWKVCKSQEIVLQKSEMIHTILRYRTLVLGHIELHTFVWVKFFVVFTWR